jgi:hypothetical protein
MRRLVDYDRGFAESSGLKLITESRRFDALVQTSVDSELKRTRRI